MEVFKYDEKRVTRINVFMKKLLAASNTDEKVKIFKEYEKDILELNPLDIFYLDFYSNNSNLSIKEIKDSANRFVNVFHNGINKHSKLRDHALFNELLAENRRMETTLAQIKQYYNRDEILSYKAELLRIFEKCLAFENKFIKFENIIFPNLEQKLPSTKPLEVLWELHDDARVMLKEIIKSLNSKSLDIERLIKDIGTYHYLIFGINQKEEIILLPVANQILDDNELNRIYNETLEIGYVFCENDLEPITTDSMAKNLGFFMTETGKVSFEQLTSMLNTLPFDITFVDKDDYVCYYNDNKNRHFPRTPSVIGRLVKNCHPPKSVHVVEAIISDFKSGKKDFEEFWIEFRGKLLYISYYAIRDENNHYLGVLEVSQDITRFREINGEKRLRDEFEES